MRVNARQIWQTALADLESAIPGANFQTWIRNTTGQSLQDDIFVLAAPSTFAKEWIENRYRNEIEAALSRVVGHRVAVQVIVENPARRSRGRPHPDQSKLPLTEDAESPEQPTEPETPRAPTAAAAVPPPAAPVEARWAPNPRSTFRTFIVGPSNQMAFAAARAVADAPAEAYNPLFIYGGVGLGKTHLLHAIAHATIGQGRRVLYVSAEQFTNDLINSIRERSTEAFRQAYRTNDILLIDDIQFIAGKEQTQEEFFHTFNALHGSDRQVVLSSDRPPRAIATLEERLRSRFEWGLIADVQPPDLETRTAILRVRAEIQPVMVPDDVIDFLARRVQRNIRELEGSLNRVVAFSQLNRRPLTVDTATAAMVDLANSPNRQRATPAQIVDTVARYFRVDQRLLRGKQRDRDIVLPRQISMYLMREETESSLLEIGRELGGRDHTTVLHGWDKIKQDVDRDDQLRRDIVAIRDLLYTVLGN
ncbi:MAG TPA: chromosomal replication initiator protein DnaA [Chloroflexota bacterium]|nr:chromosomal replication initiator protein DnaA [Chloroflexota bacterium]